MTHELKVWPQYFEMLLDGRKKFEVRENDRNFQLGDVLTLREFDPDEKRYNAGMCTKKVTSILYGPKFGIERGYCVMGLNDINWVYKNPHVEEK